MRAPAPDNRIADDDVIPPWRSWSARSAEAREVLVRFQGVGPPQARVPAHGSVAKWPCSGFLIRLTRVRSPPVPRLDRERRNGPTTIQKIGRSPHRERPPKRVKCCGDTLVRHTSIVGFNSHRPLELRVLPEKPYTHKSSLVRLQDGPLLRAGRRRSALPL